MLGLVYEQLLVPCLQNDGWEVLAGKVSSGGTVLRPMVYRGPRRGLPFDYVLHKDGRTYLAEAKAWPVFEMVLRA